MFKKGNNDSVKLKSVDMDKTHSMNEVKKPKSTGSILDLDDGFTRHTNDNALSQGESVSKEIYVDPL